MVLSIRYGKLIITGLEFYQNSSLKIQKCFDIIAVCLEYQLRKRLQPELSYSNIFLTAIPFRLV